jgi:hypothetical protein
MLRRLLVVALLLGVFALGVLVARPRPEETKPPDPPALVERLREVARLETLEVSLYKKVSFEPDPAPTGSLWSDLAQWARFSLNAPRGRAIVFADASIGLDVAQLTAQGLRARGKTVEVVLPPLSVQVALRPGETEVIGSNLDSAQTAQLLEKAKRAFAQEVAADPALTERATRSAKRAMAELLHAAGFVEVLFVPKLTPETAG